MTMALIVRRVLPRSGEMLCGCLVRYRLGSLLRRADGLNFFPNPIEISVLPVRWNRYDGFHIDAFCDRGHVMRYRLGPSRDYTISIP